MLAIKGVKFKNHSKFYKLLLLLSADIKLNPGLNQINHSDTLWHPFKHKGLHFLHLK